MKSTLRFARRAAGAIYKQLNPSPEVAAHQMLEALAAKTPRHTTGRVTVLGLDLEYSDLLSFCPQFSEMFVNRALTFQTASAAPRCVRAARHHRPAGGCRLHGASGRARRR